MGKKDLQQLVKTIDNWRQSEKKCIFIIYTLNCRCKKMFFWPIFIEIFFLFSLLLWIGKHSDSQMKDSKLNSTQMSPPWRLSLKG